MTSHSGNDPAGRLLDAQVEFVLAELTGERLHEVIERDAKVVLAALDRVVVADAVSRDDAKAVAHRYVSRRSATAT